ncbi:MAG: type II toxin-antitoxin system PemK/MazF family toxin [Deltaproteobacteria bacterium]|nr:type II toxin-antitoxin system PemK/MazF family toxin [Deltaproteobacteria bacterium]
MTCERWDVVVVPFPFTDKVGSKKRPALVLSVPAFNYAGHTVLAMITSKGHSPWPGDTTIRDLAAAGLRVPCLVRLKLFTLDNRLILSRLGTLGEADAESAQHALRTAVP